MTPAHIQLLTRRVSHKRSLQEAGCVYKHLNGKLGVRKKSEDEIGAQAKKTNEAL